MQVACGSSPAFAERKMVGVTGLEPVTLRLSSACSNQLSYTPIPAACRAVARSTEIRMRSTARFLPQRGIRRGSLALASLRAKAGGAEGIRTPDLQLAKLPLYQLSYSPNLFSIYDFGFTRANTGMRVNRKSYIVNPACQRVRSLPLVCSKSIAFEN